MPSEEEDDEEETSETSDGEHDEDDDRRVSNRNNILSHFNVCYCFISFLLFFAMFVFSLFLAYGRGR